MRVTSDPLAEFESTLIRARTQAALQAARARGRQGGRLRTLSEDKRRIAQSLRDDRTRSVAAICKSLGTTFYCYTTGNADDTEGKQ